MMRVMVVEDEEMIRKGIVMAVDWAALDCIVVGEAANGEQALAVAVEYMELAETENYERIFTESMIFPGKKGGSER